MIEEALMPILEKNFPEVSSYHATYVFEEGYFNIDQVRKAALDWWDNQRPEGAAWVQMLLNPIQNPHALGNSRNGSAGEILTWQATILYQMPDDTSTPE